MYIDLYSREFSTSVHIHLILLHWCGFFLSAGVGRTGTYITLDNVFDQIEAEGLVDIDGVIVKARKQRMKMVQTKVWLYAFQVETFCR